MHACKFVSFRVVTFQVGTERKPSGSSRTRRRPSLSIFLYMRSRVSHFRSPCAYLRVTIHAAAVAAAAAPETSSSAGRTRAVASAVAPVGSVALVGSVGTQPVRAAAAANSAGVTHA